MSNEGVAIAVKGVVVMSILLVAGAEGASRRIAAADGGTGLAGIGRNGRNTSRTGSSNSGSSMATMADTKRALAVGATVLLDEGLAVELLADAGPTVQSPPSATELLKRHLRLNGGRVERGLVVDALVDGDGGVNDGGLDDLALDDGLNDLVHVMVDVLGAEDLALDLLVRGGQDRSGALEVGRLRFQPLRNLGLLVVLRLVHHHGHHVVLVRFGCNDSVHHGLDPGLIVILVDFPVDGDRLLHLLHRHNRLLRHRRPELFAHLRVMLAVLV